MNGDIEQVRVLLARSADVNEAQGDGMTALHWAAKNGDEELAGLLIQAGADVEPVTRIGSHTPLHVAAASARGSLVRLLLKAGSKSNAATTTGATPLHFAAASGDPAAVSALLESGAALDAREPVWGQTPLMFAAAAGRNHVIQVLLEEGGDPALTARVIDISARNKADQADRRKRRESLLKMQSPGDQGTRDSDSQPDQQSVQASRESTALLEADARKLDAIEAAERRGGEPVPLNYADLVGTHGGLTALLLAAREGHAEATLELISGGADINQLSAADNTSPMLMAMINGHFDLAMSLFERGADPNLASDAGATPLYAALNMQWAPKARHPQPVAYQQQKISYLEVMRTLLKAGVDPNVRLKRTLWYTTYNRDLLGVDRTGATPFWRAAHALDLEAMRLLLAFGADPTLPTTKVPNRRKSPQTDHSGLPAIPVGGPAVYPIHAVSGVGYGQGYAGNSHRHVPEGWLPAVRFLVEEMGADVNARDHNGYTPLHHAAARGDNPLIHYLLERGADVTAVSRRGQTTVDMANGPVQRIQPFPETIALLERLGAKNNHNCVSC